MHASQLPVSAHVAGVPAGDLAIYITKPQRLHDKKTPLLAFGNQLPRHCHWIKALRPIRAMPNYMLLQLARTDPLSPHYKPLLGKALCCSAASIPDADDLIAETQFAILDQSRSIKTKRIPVFGPFESRSTDRFI